MRERLRPTAIGAVMIDGVVSDFGLASSSRARAMFRTREPLAKRP